MHSRYLKLKGAVGRLKATLTASCYPLSILLNMHYMLISEFNARVACYCCDKIRTKEDYVEVVPIKVVEVYIVSRFNLLAT